MKSKYMMCITMVCFVTYIFVADNFFIRFSEESYVWLGLGGFIMLLANIIGWSNTDD